MPVDEMTGLHYLPITIKAEKMKPKKEAKPKAVLKITASYWVNSKNAMFYEAKGRDVMGNKYTFTVESQEPKPSSKAANFVSPLEWERIKAELNAQINQKYSEIVEAFNAAYLAKAPIDKASKAVKPRQIDLLESITEVESKTQRS